MNARLLMVALIASAAAPGSARADDAALSFVTTADLAAKTKAGASSGWQFTIVDARTRVEYQEAHIAGAINVPASAIAARLPKLVKDKRRELIFYCNGPKCTKSQKAARAALSLGYRNVFEYNEGMPAWGKARLPVDGTPLPPVDVPAVSADELQKRLKSKSPPYLLDLRDPEEFAALHIAGAANVPLDDLERSLATLPRSRPIVLTDHTGSQSPIGGRLLNHLGVRTLERLDGGILSWQQKGLPVEALAVAGGR